MTDSDLLRKCIRCQGSLNIAGQCPACLKGDGMRVNWRALSPVVNKEDHMVKYPWPEQCRLLAKDIYNAELSEETLRMLVDHVSHCFGYGMPSDEAVERAVILYFEGRMSALGGTVAHPAGDLAGGLDDSVLKPFQGEYGIDRLQARGDRPMLLGTQPLKAGEFPAADPAFWLWRVGDGALDADIVRADSSFMAVRNYIEHRLQSAHDGFGATALCEEDSVCVAVLDDKTYSSLREKHAYTVDDPFDYCFDLDEELEESFCQACTDAADVFVVRVRFSATGQFYMLIKGDTHDARESS